MTVALGIHESIFNNYLSDTFGLGADARGWLEFPRELPGLLVVLVAGVLFALPVTRMGMVGAGVFAAGMAGLGLFGGTLGMMLVMMIVGSAGMHLVQPVVASIILALSDDHNRGRRMGQAGAVGTIGVVVGSGAVWLFFDAEHPAYMAGFLGAACMALLAGVFYAMMHMPNLHQPRAKLVFRRRFGLYYFLEFLFGARKQIFITFGPWVLIKVYGLPASSIAGLFMTGALIGIVFKPLAGMAVDHFGERKVMVFDGIALAFVCIGYGYALDITGREDLALNVACVCFVVDNLLFALGTSRAVYLSRMTRDPQELTSSLAMGISINHIASMVIPTMAGALWVGFGFERVFLAAAVFALGISAVSSRVPGKEHW